MPELTPSERLARMEQWRQELVRFHELFVEAFDELHAAVVAAVKVPGTFVGTHYGYPSMSMTDGGFPSFNDTPYYRDNAPRDYVSVLRPMTLGALLGGYVRPEVGFPKGEALTTFLRTSRFATRLGLKEDSLSWAIDRMVGESVERYLHLYGLDAPLEDKRRDDIIWPMLSGVVHKQLHLRLVVPITLTHFEVDHFKLTDNTYILKLPKSLQLARSRVKSYGSGAPGMVVGAATHAFVSTEWHIESDTTSEVRQSLSNISGNVIEAIDRFFGALRLVTGIETGYAQVTWAPKHWALDYFCELPTLYGGTIRNYPATFDNYGWSYLRPTVTRAQLVEVRRVFKSIVENRADKVAIALRRLNSCLVRTDGADGLLDAIIGLEVLLGDDQNQSLSYKLRMRAGALALLAADATRSPVDVAKAVNKVYGARSEIVHGKRTKDSKKATETADPRYDDERLAAAELLRFVLDVLLSHPRYMEPANIDADLLLRGLATAEPAVAKPPKPRAKPRSRKPTTG